MVKRRWVAVFVATCLNAGLASAQTTTTTAPTTTTTTAPTTTQGGGTGGNRGGGTGIGQGGQQFNETASTVQTIQMQSMQSGAGSATTWPSNANPFVQTYIDPLSVGLPSKFATQVGITKPTGTFNKPLYTNTTTTSAGGGGGAATTNQQVGFTTYGTPRAPLYSTVLSDDIPPVTFKSEDLQASVRSVIARSSYVPSKANIQVSMDGTTVHLQGLVATEKERRLVEGMVRTTPGVRDVVNHLEVAARK